MRIRKDNLTDEERDIIEIASISDALAHPVRVKILKYILLKNSERIIVHNKALVEHFDYSQSTISQHVKKMVDANVITVRKKDKFSEYYANIGIIGKFIKMLSTIK